jgi:hypothetical protein
MWPVALARSKYLYNRTESLQRGERAISANCRRPHRSMIGMARAIPGHALAVTNARIAAASLGAASLRQAGPAQVLAELESVGIPAEWRHQHVAPDRELWITLDHALDRTPCLVLQPEFS